MILNIFPNGKILSLNRNLQIPDFTVITGENGSGKTQLLEFLRDYQHGYHVYDEKEDREVFIPVASSDNGELILEALFTPPGLVSPSINYHHNLMETINQQWDEIKNVTQSYSLIQGRTFDDEQQELNALNNAIAFTIRNFLRDNQMQPIPGNINTQKIELKHLRELKRLAEITMKPIGEITQIDLIAFFAIPPNFLAPYVDLLFHQYFLKKKYYPRMVENLKPPIDVFNGIIADKGFNYTAVYNDVSHDLYPPALTLYDEARNQVVPLSQLSSGEKTILSLIFTLYSSKLGGSFPGLMLFDEPDAHLHPSLTKIFLDVVRNVFVNENKIKVLLTTHSPSTVALAPPESLYVMEKGTLRKEDKKRAIKKLSAGLNNINLLYENNKQVFVEAKMDEWFYNEIYNLLQSKITPDVSLTFIAVGNDKDGGCQRVKDLTREFSNAGNTYVCGIIDWDTVNKPSEKVRVLGFGQRYNIESYIFDPLNVALFLLKTRKGNLNELGFDQGDRYTNILEFQAEKLQVIVDAVVNKVRDNLKVEVNDAEKLEYILENGLKLTIPRWYSNYNGHHLEKLIKDTFQPFQSAEFRDSDALKKAIVRHVINDYPELIPIDLSSTLREIQNISIH